MAKQLEERTRIHVYGLDAKGNNVKAFVLIGFDYRIQGEPDGSVVNLIRGDEKRIKRLLKYYGDFTKEDMERILSLDYKESYWADDYSQVIRIA